MTSPPQPAPGASAPVGQFLRPLRDLAAYALVGATALWLLVAVLDLIPSGSNQFAGRTEGSFDNFVNLPTIAFPLAAVLLALLVQPRHPRARLIVQAAVVEYAVMAFFGVLFGVLIGLINTAADHGARAAFEGLLVRIGWLAVFAVAAYATFLIWQRMFTTPRPAEPPAGVYGQPPQFHPGAYPGQPGYAAPFPPHPGSQHPGSPQPGSQQPGGPNPPFGGPQPGGPQSAGVPGGSSPGGMPPAPGGFGATTYGQPQNPSWNQPAPPHGGPPAPVSAQPAPDAPASAPPFSEPTQVFPQQAHPGAGPEDERTQKLDETRPGFGPAEPDPPRS